MPIKFSEHALKQLKPRGLTKKEVIDVVRNPQQILPSFKGRKLRQKEIDGKLIEVVTKTEGPSVTVITAYPLED